MHATPLWLDLASGSGEPLWKTASTVQLGKSIPLVVEVVSTNWRDDYTHKLVEYEAMGVIEYWIVDFRALGAVRYIGQPKQSTITICRLVDGEYQLERLVSGQPLRSYIFPEIELTTGEVFQSAEL